MKKFPEYSLLFLALPFVYRRINRSRGFSYLQSFLQLDYFLRRPLQEFVNGLFMLFDTFPEIQETFRFEQDHPFFEGRNTADKFGQPLLQLVQSGMLRMQSRAGKGSGPGVAHDGQILAPVPVFKIKFPDYFPGQIGGDFPPFDGKDRQQQKVADDVNQAGNAPAAAPDDIDRLRGEHDRGTVAGNLQAVQDVRQDFLSGQRSDMAVEADPLPQLQQAGEGQGLPQFGLTDVCSIETV